LSARGRTKKDAPAEKTKKKKKKRAGEVPAGKPCVRVEKLSAKKGEKGHAVRRKRTGSWGRTLLKGGDKKLNVVKKKKQNHRLEQGQGKKSSKKKN